MTWKNFKNTSLTCVKGLHNVILAPSTCVNFFVAITRKPCIRTNNYENSRRSSCREIRLLHT